MKYKTLAHPTLASLDGEMSELASKGWKRDGAIVVVAAGRHRDFYQVMALDISPEAADEFGKMLVRRGGMSADRRPGMIERWHGGVYRAINEGFIGYEVKDGHLLANGRNLGLVSEQHFRVPDHWQFTMPDFCRWALYSD